jgi:hypothetical protein
MLPATCLVLSILAIWIRHHTKANWLDQSEMRRVRRVCDRVHGDERFPYE